MSAEVDWLRAQIEARKATAEAAEPGPWVVEHNVPLEGWRISAKHAPVVDLGIEGDGGVLVEPDAEHIAANDPQDTIALCDAQLAILDDYEQLRRAVYTGDETNAADIVEPFIRLLASGYRHHDGYPFEGAS